MAKRHWENDPKDLSYTDIYKSIFNDTSVWTLEEPQTYKSLETLLSAGWRMWTAFDQMNPPTQKNKNTPYF